MKVFFKNKKKAAMFSSFEVKINDLGRFKKFGVVRKLPDLSF